MYHIIIDFMFLYYKYYYMLKAGRLPSLTANIPDEYKDILEGDSVDVSTIYYPVREIELLRKSIELQEGKAVVSVCFDAKLPQRKSNDTDYKSNRKKVLSAFDYVLIHSVIRPLLSEAGHNVYYRDCTEADDLVYNLVRQYKDKFNGTIIVTPDTDLMINICDPAMSPDGDMKGYVDVWRYKRNSTLAVGVSNFEAYLRNEYSTYIPYNALLLYKCIVGDKSDNIKGVKGWGVKAYENVLDAIIQGRSEYDRAQLFKSMNNPDCVKQALKELMDKGVLITKERYNQADEALDMMTPIIFDIDEPIKRPSRAQRVQAYTKLNMTSLID